MKKNPRSVIIALDVFLCLMVQLTKFHSYTVYLCIKNGKSVSILNRHGAEMLVAAPIMVNNKNLYICSTNTLVQDG